MKGLESAGESLHKSPRSWEWGQESKWGLKVSGMQARVHVGVEGLGRGGKNLCKVEGPRRGGES
jgi:hypothetical protein